MNKIHPDEEKAIKFLAKRDDETLREVKLAWAQERVPYSAIPMTLLASQFLDESRELPVVEKDNPRWHAILLPSEAACTNLQMRRTKLASWLRMAMRTQRVCSRLACKHDHRAHSCWQVKFRAFFRRCSQRYNTKVKDTIAKGKAPNCRSFASHYRDSNPELAWRMTCLWVEAAPSVQARCSEQRVGAPGSA